MEENKRDQTWFGLAMILCGAFRDVASGRNFDWIGGIRLYCFDDDFSRNAEC